MVLLKNEGASGAKLPLSKDKKTAVIGPLAKNGHDMLGPWWGRGQDEDAVTVFDGIKAQSIAADDLRRGLLDRRTYEPPNNRPRPNAARRPASTRRSPPPTRPTRSCSRSASRAGRAARPPRARRSTCPGQQEELIRRIKATGKPFVVVLFNGRPLTLEGVVDDAPAILEAWFPGVQAGNAVADVVFGKVNPGGKLPVSFPRRVGQVPIYYNHEPTGRPCNADVEVQLALPRHPELRAAVPVRLRPQLQQVRDLEPAG